MSDSFIYQNQKIPIIPPENFSKMELKSRLHKMNVAFNPNEKNKKYYINLYNESIQNNNNKLKIIEDLIDDTKKHNNYMNELKKMKEEKTHQNYQYNPKVNNKEIFNPVKNNYIYDKFKVKNDMNDNSTKNNYEIPSSLINDSQYNDYNNNINFPNNIYMAGNNKKVNTDNINIDPNSFPIQNESIYKDEYPLKNQDNKTVNPDFLIKNKTQKFYTNFDTPFGPESNTSSNYNNTNKHNEYNPINKNEGVFPQNNNNFQNTNNNLNSNNLNEKKYDVPYQTQMNYNPNIFLNNNQNSFQNINKIPIKNQNNPNMNVNKNLNNPNYQNIKNQNQNENQTFTNMNKNTNELNMPNKFLESIPSNTQKNNKEFNSKPISYPNLDVNNFQQNMNNYNNNVIQTQNQNYPKLNYYNKNELNIPKNQPYNNNNNMSNNIANNNNNNNKYNNNKNMYNPQNYKFNKNPQNEDNEINTSKQFQQDIPIQKTNVSLVDTNFNNTNNNNNYHYNNNNNKTNIPYTNHYYIYNNVPSNNPDNYKESSNIGFTLLAMFLAMIVIGFGIWVIMKYSRIAIKEVNEALTPKNIFYNVILKVILIIIKKLCWDYLYYPLPFVIFYFGIHYLKQIIKKKKLIKEIFNDIKSRLIEMYNTNATHRVMGITEGEIINSYSIRYNITFNDFNRNYMPQLRELRKRNNNIKEKEEIINGYKQMYWYWNE